MHLDQNYPTGWAFHSADFSRNCKDSVIPGTVTLSRVGRNLAAWYNLSDDAKYMVPIYAVASGYSIGEAIEKAIELAKREGTLEGTIYDV